MAVFCGDLSLIVDSRCLQIWQKSAMVNVIVIGEADAHKLANGIGEECSKCKHSL